MLESIPGRKLFYGLVLLSVTIFVSLDCDACRMTREGKQNFFVNPSLKASGIFSDGSGRSASPSVVERCQPNAGKYLMISSGIRVPSLNSDTADISFDGTYFPNACSVKHYLDQPLQTFEQKKANFDVQYRFLRQCTHIQIYDTDKRHIGFKYDQPSCKVTALQDGILRLDGEYCFVQISPANRFAIQVVLNDECRKPETLNSLGISAQDLEGVLNTYVVGDDSGLSTDIDPLGSNRFRFYIQPNSSLLPLSEVFDEQTPRFVTTFNADLHMGSVRVRGQNNVWFLDLALLARNTSPDTCKNSECVKVSNFSVPVVGEVELFRKMRNRFESIDSWWFASLLESNFEGILRNPERNIMDLNLSQGDEMRVTVTFVDPFEDFNLFVSQIQQFLIDLKGVQGTPGIDVIQSISPLAQLIGLNYLDGLPNLRSPDMTGELEKVLDALNRFGQNSQWPSYFERVCSSDLKKCVRAGRSKFYLKLALDFKIGQGETDTGHLVLEELKVTRDSKVDGSYSKAVTSLPEVVCE